MRKDNDKILEWTSRYFATSAADYTEWGFAQDGVVYSFVADKALMTERARVTVTSSRKGRGEKLMLNKLTEVQRQAIIASGLAKIVCTEKALNAHADAMRINRGQAFEDILSLQTGNDGYKKGDRRGYWQEGDIVVNGKQVQVKFEACSLAEFKTIEKAEKELARE